MSQNEPTPAVEEDRQRRTMRYWLARTLRELREQKGVSRDAIRWLVPGRNGQPMDISTLSRFESPEAAAGTWPHRVDEVVAAYAYMCGIEDGRDLWRLALDRFIKDGGAPVLGELSPELRAVLLALEASQRTKPYGVESRDKPTSRRRRSAGD